MENYSHLKTIFSDRPITTEHPEQYVGYCLSQPVVKTWIEDFIDEDTGEVSSIERSETLLSRGTRITPDTLATIRFFMSEGSCQSVTVSEVPRSGSYIQSDYMQHYLFTLSVDGCKQTLYLAAKGDMMAVQIAHDFAEQVCEGFFYFESLRRTNLKFVPLPETAPEEDSMGEPIVRQYFQVVVSVKYREELKPCQLRYLTFAKNADEASDTIRDFRLEERIKEERKDSDHPTIEEERILKVSPIDVAYIVPDRFVAEYSQSSK